MEIFSQGRIFNLYWTLINKENVSCQNFLFMQYKQHIQYFVLLVVLVQFYNNTTRLFGNKKQNK